MRYQQPTVAVLGDNTLAERILARLLEDEGYDTKLLGPSTTGFIDELLEGVDVLLLSPHLDATVRGAFLNAMRSTPEVAQGVPVLSLSFPLTVALLDELAVNGSWQSLFEGLVQRVEDALRRAAASTGALPVDAGEVRRGIPRSSEAT